ncbi:hypothetical protein UFOVP71_153 [uncultured Caudovirales phage]|uniref:Uncharacterized protein n=1 Tax=uncultured Caudovirales phage TaxID=2100421 RepID=A0A6J5T9K9_9CAUD|nr:hypothetical protein UFOVP71_153 [uncultured Caudovirales phage]
MRNLEAEEKLARRLHMLAGGGFLLGLVALAVGTELLILDYYTEDRAMFWCWQGLWVIVLSIVISKIAAVFKKA